MEAQLLRIVHEALTNIRKHAKPEKATITIDTDQHETWIHVIDDGRGFQMKDIPAPAGYHIGLKIMQERAMEFGGQVQIGSTLGQGTESMLSVPMELS